MLKIKDNLALVFSNVIGAAINGIFWIYLASILEKTEYGELGYLLSIAGLSSTFALIGLPTLIVVYGAKKEPVFAPAYMLGVGTGIVATILTLFITQNIVISIVVIGLVFFNLLEAEFNSKKRYIAYSINSLSRKILMVVFVLFFYYTFGFEGILWGYVLSLLPGLYSIYSFVRSKKMSVSLLKPKIRFMINTYFTGLIQTLLFTADKIIIGSLAGFMLLGSYQLTIQPLLMIQVVPSALMVYLLPKESEGSKNKKFKIYSFLIALILSVVVFFSIPYIVEQFLPKYEEAIFPIQVMVFGIIPITANMILSTEFIAREKTTTVLIGTIIQTGTFLSLIPILGTEWLGLLGIVYAFLIATLSHLVYLMSKKYIFV